MHLYPSGCDIARTLSNYTRAGAAKLFFCWEVVIEHNGVYLQRLPTVADAKTHTMGRYYKQKITPPNKSVRHEAMMAARPKHVRMIKYVTGANEARFLTVFFGKFELTCIVSGKHANSHATSVSFPYEYADGLTTGCAINTNLKSICRYKWDGLTGPKLGYYEVNDETRFGGVRFVDVHLNDCLTVEEYEMIRETIAWTWNAIDSGEFEFPQGHAYNRVSLKTA